MLDPLMDMELNCAGQVRLLEACRSFNPRAKVVFISTRQVYGKPFPPERGLIDVGSFYASYQKIEAALGWRPKMPVDIGLQQTIEFYAKHREHYWNPGADVFAQAQARAVGD